MKDKKRAQKAYQTIKKGGLIAAPSRVGYTLLGNTDNAIKKMFDLKGRPLSKPCVVLTRRDLLDEYAVIPKKYTPLINAINDQKLLCGFILKRKRNPIFKNLPKFVKKYSKRENNTSCFVINTGFYLEHFVDQALKDQTLVVGSSCNKSGTGNEGVFINIPENIRAGVDYCLNDDEYVSIDYNPQTREQGVMIDLTGDKPLVTRIGLMYSKIQKLIDQFSP